MNEHKKIIFVIAALLFTGVVCGYLVLSKKSYQQKNSNNQAKQNSAPQKTASDIAGNLAEQSKIKKFVDAGELKDFLEKNSASAGYGYGGYRGLAEPAVDSLDVWGGAKQGESLGMEEKTVSAAPTAGNGVISDYSKTNAQVEGVDEADIIKTDGEYVYAVVKNDLYIIDAKPAESADIVSKIAFKSRPQDLYVNGDSLIVYGGDDLIDQADVYKNFKRRGVFTFLKVFDTSDKKNPKQTRDLDFEGNYFDSRMIGDYVYFATSDYNFYYIDGEPTVPRILSGGKVVSGDCAEAVKCFAPGVYYFDMPYSSYTFTNVTAVNVKDNSEPIKGEAYLMSSGQNMYVSQNNIYITYPKYISEYQLQMDVLREIVYPKLSVKDQEKIAKIEAVDSFILNDEEKMQKISFILERYAVALSDDEEKQLEKNIDEKMKQKYQDISKELEKTVIHKIAVNNGDLQYKATGEVTGHVLNQFSMDENNGYFRIATAKNQTWSRYASEEQKQSYNNLYVLDDNLKIVGAVEDLAKGETIYSVRFMQNRAYLVTFKQTDPLFAIDLSDPAKPKVLGELKVPGFSNYLHPYDDTTLIGFGKDAGENEWGGVKTKGLKLTLFDVADVSKPKEIDTYIMGDAGSDSIALSDHKAFLFSRDKNLLVVPVSIREAAGDFDWGDLTFGGAMVFKVDKTGFELKGKIDHSDGGQPSDYDYWDGYQYYNNTVKRSLYIGDTVYTFSNKYLKMNKISDLTTIKNLELKKEKTGSGSDFDVVN